MSTAALLLLASRRRLRTGPALRGGPLPVTAALVSAVSHGALVAALFFAASAWSASQPKTYIVNLVPAVAAVGTPQGRPALPPRAEEAPRPAPSKPSDLPAREPARAPAPQMPSRPVTLPDRVPPPRPAATPRASEKELPPVASAAPAKPTPEPAATARAETPPASLGRPSGSAQGAGAVTLEVSDFPFAWYLAAVQRKITERWEGRALQGRQPVAVFEITREGQVTRLAIEKTSGNPYYDQAALRAITEAKPFPPLPEGFQGSMLRIHLGFNFAPERG